MAGYSGTPLPKKLGIKPGHVVALLEAPAGFETQLTGIADDVRIVRRLNARARYGTIVLFARDCQSMCDRFVRAAQRLQPAGGLWVAWPKKASGVATDLSDAVVRDFGLAQGLVDNKVCAIDETWSGLRFVIRLENRSQPARATTGKTSKSLS